MTAETEQNWVKQGPDPWYERLLRATYPDDEEAVQSRLLDYELTSTNEIYNLDGVPWHEAPVPGRFHKCRPQTKGWAGSSYVERCACGGINYAKNRYGWDYWMERNQRTKDGEGPDVDEPKAAVKPPTDDWESWYRRGKSIGFWFGVAAGALLVIAVFLVVFVDGGVS